MSRPSVADYIDQFHNPRYPDYPLLKAGPRVIGRFFGCALGSAFQPVLHAGDGTVAGHAATVRCEPDWCGGETQDGLSPWGLLAHAGDPRHLVNLDRVCRALHMLNYFAAPEAAEHLFLRIHPGLLAGVGRDYGRVFEEILARFGLTPRRIVIRLPREADWSDARTRQALADYRRRGYTVALEAAAGARLGALGETMPHILEFAAAALDKRREARRLAAEAHERGLHLLVKQVEHARHVDAAAGAHARYLQGRLFGAAQPLPLRTPASPQTSTQFLHA